MSTPDTNYPPGDFANSTVRYQYLLSFLRTCYVEAKYLLPKVIP